MWFIKIQPSDYHIQGFLINVQGGHLSLLMATFMHAAIYTFRTPFLGELIPNGLHWGKIKLEEIKTTTTTIHNAYN